MAEGVTHPAIINAREVIKLEEQARHELDERVGRAIMLAPSLDICRALLRGENVPLSKLNPRWVRKYGVRRDAA